MTEDSWTIDELEPPAERPVLWELLEEFHAWMHENYRPYDPEAELTGDRESLAAAEHRWAWIASVDESPAGCVLLYGDTAPLAEFRRLWVRPQFRGRGLGAALTRTVIEKAQDAGFDTLGLTAPPWSLAAVELYESMGFERTPPYPETRLSERFHDDAIFMQRALTDRH